MQRLGTCGEGDANTCGGFGDPCCDLEQAHPQGSELGGREPMQLAVIGSEKLTLGGNIKLTHPTEWFLQGGGTDAEGGGSDGVGSSCVANCLSTVGFGHHFRVRNSQTVLQSHTNAACQLRHRDGQTSSSISQEANSP